MHRLILWSVALIFLAPAIAAAQCEDRQTAQLFQSKRDFYTRTQAGTLALVPNAVQQNLIRYENSYLAFESSGTYAVKRNAAKSAEWWFVVNHRRKTGEPTYIGILVMKMLQGKPDYSVELFRAGEWMRLNEQVPNPVEEQSQWLEDFPKLHAPESTLKAFDDRFVKWHAIPKGGRRLSWDFRAGWNINLQQVLDSLKKVSNWGDRPAFAFLQGRLLRYEMTETWNTSKPLSWNLDTSGQKALFIKTFSPDEATFAKQYCIVIED
jgi:hypothetical protein